MNFGSEFQVLACQFPSPNKHSGNERQKTDKVSFWSHRVYIADVALCRGQLVHILVARIHVLVAVIISEVI